MLILHVVRSIQMPMIQKRSGHVQDTYLFGNNILKYEKVDTQQKSTIHYFERSLSTRHNTHTVYHDGPIKKTSLVSLW